MMEKFGFMNRQETLSISSKLGSNPHSPLFADPKNLKEKIGSSSLVYQMKNALKRTKPGIKATAILGVKLNELRRKTAESDIR